MLFLMSVCGTNTKIPVAGSCQLYWICDQGNVVDQGDCYDELPLDDFVFDPIKEQCDFKQFVPCANEDVNTGEL